ncbi:MAG TPA: DMT family transporter [Gemmatimonadaceae bacterium]|nr:DMT family transporter [Gemmatimonadaceae bacterium]
MLAVLLLAVLGISVAAPLVRLSHADPLAIAAWRLFFSLIIIAAFLVPTRGWTQWRRLDRRGALLATGAGVLLALHFWGWNSSVDMTTVAASVILVNTQPIVVALLSAAWLHERPSGRQWVGIVLAVAGAAIVAWGDAGGLLHSLGSRAVLGDLLALGAGVAAALYYLAGRRLRQVLDVWPYVALVYGACFVTLLVIAGLARVPLLPQPPRELAIFVALAVGPMLLGHTGMNWALKFLPAYLVNLTVLGEPVGATLLAALLPGIREVPPRVTLIGGALVLAGILLALSRRTTPSRGTTVSNAV